MTQTVLPSTTSTGRLAAWPQPGFVCAVPQSGIYELTGPDGSETPLLVPIGVRPGEHMPLLIVLHGAAGADGGLEEIAMRWAAANGVLALAPRSADMTWDILRGGYGRDLAAIDALLHQVTRDYAVDPARVALAGFSDGASYALSVGLSNGDLFSDVMAFSPGFAIPKRHGQPRIFIAHGSDDPVLPTICGRGLAERLAGDGYDVRYEDFAGGHTVRRDIAVAAFDRFLQGRRDSEQQPEAADRGSSPI